MNPSIQTLNGRIDMLIMQAQQRAEQRATEEARRSAEMARKQYEERRQELDDILTKTIGSSFVLMGSYIPTSGNNATFVLPFNGGFTIDLAVVDGWEEGIEIAATDHRTSKSTIISHAYTEEDGDRILLLINEMITQWS